MLGIQHIDMLNLRRRSESESERDEVVRKAESDVKVDFGMGEETKDECMGCGQKNEPESEPTEQGGSRAEKSEASGRAKKGRVVLKVKAKTWMWSDVVKLGIRRIRDKHRVI